MTAATCPACGHAQSVFAVFIRVGDDLVCQSCRDGLAATRHPDGGGSPLASLPAAASPHRHLEGRVG